MKNGNRHTINEAIQSAAFSFPRWREIFLKTIVYGVVSIGLGSALLASLDVLSNGNSLQRVVFPVIYFGAWLLSALILLIRRPFWLRAGILVLMLYILGVSSLLETGMRGDANLFFLVFVVFSTLLFSQRSGIYAAIFSVLTVGVAAGLLLTGRISLTSKLVAVGELNLWIVGAISLLLMEIIVIIGLREFLKEFDSTQQRVEQVLGNLENERMLLRTVIDNLPALIFATDKSGRKMLANSADLNFSGIPTGADFLNKTDLEILDSGEQIINREDLVTDVHQQKRWLLTSKKPLRGKDGEIIGLVGIVQDITASKYSEMSLQRYGDRMEIIHKIDELILAAHSPEQIARSTLAGLVMLIPNTAIEITQYDLSTCQVLQLAHAGDHLLDEDSRAKDWEYVEKLRPGEPVFIKEYGKAAGLSLLSMPLLVKGELTGALNLYGDAGTIHTLDNLVITREIADQIAIALRQSQLLVQTSQANKELLFAYDTTIEGWAKALEMRDMETEGHSHRVMEKALAVAVKMGFQGEELVHLRRGALLHDIGKMGIPDSILRKKGPLDGDEWMIMRKHPKFAYDLLSTIDFLKPALDVPFCHHEKWDGSGYPGGLKGKEIPLPARIFAIVDVWDALTNERAYRPAWSNEKALEYIQDNAGRHFDPQVVDNFLKTLEQE